MRQRRAKSSCVRWCDGPAADTAANCVVERVTKSPPKMGAKGAGRLRLYGGNADDPKSAKMRRPAELRGLERRSFPDLFRVHDGLIPRCPTASNPPWILEPLLWPRPVHQAIQRSCDGG